MAGLAWRALQAIAYEFLPLRMTARPLSVMVELCRLSGAVALAGIVRVSLSGPPPPTPAAAVALAAFALLLGIGVGSIVKQMAYAFCGQMTNWAGHDFERSGVTLRGDPFIEIWCADGTWYRSELKGVQIASEWTDTEGDCHQLVFELEEGLGVRARTSMFARLAPLPERHAPERRDSA